jgi:hypothetical protein
MGIGEVLTMSIAALATEMVSAVRAQGEVPAYLAVSPDVFDTWQQENDGVEPIDVLGLPIRIRDNYKPKTMLILGQKVELADRG